jgi:hypothetical protein
MIKKFVLQPRPSIFVHQTEKNIISKEVKEQIVMLLQFVASVAFNHDLAGNTQPQWPASLFTCLLPKGLLWGGSP